MQTRGSGHWAAFLVLLGATVLVTTAASAMEVQLAGIRIDAPWVTVLDVYGNPDGVVLGAPPAAAAAGGGAGAAAGGAQPMGGGMGGPMGGPMGALAGAVGAYGGAMNEAMGGPAMPGMPGGMPGGMMGGGMPGGAGGPAGGAAGAAAGAGAGSGGGFPMWASPIAVELDPNEVEWIYRKGEVVIGFVFNTDGYVKIIAVAGEDCDYARTALWRPHRYVKLGDDFKRVLYRYGYPDKVETFIGDTGAGTGAAPGGGGAGPAAAGAGPGAPGAMPGGGAGPGAGPGPGAMPGGGAPGGMRGGPGGGGGAGAPGGGAGGAPLGAISVTFNGTTNEYSRDCVVTYSDKNNIAFTLHNMKVTRIHIWKGAGS